MATARCQGWVGRVVGIFPLSVLVLGAACLVGCGSKSDQPPATPATSSFAGLTLNVAVVADTDLGEAERLIVPLGAQRGEWESRNDARIEVLPSPLSLDEVVSANADLLIFRGELLGGLIDRGALASIPEESLIPAASGDDEAEPLADAFAFADILPGFREHAVRYGTEQMSLPLGASALVLVYRRDAFESQKNRVDAESADLTLEPPTTYEDLEALAAFFQGRDWNDVGTEDAGIALSLGHDPEGLGTAIYLARAASLGLHPDYFSFLFDSDTLEPLIDRQPFQDALQSLLALAEAGPDGVRQFDAEAARDAFRSGRTALLIDRAEMAAHWCDTETPFPVGVAPLPGSSRVFDPARESYQDLDRTNRPSYLPQGGGWMVGVSESPKARQREAALDYVRDLSGPETSARLLADRDAPMLPVRGALLGVGLPDPRSAPGLDSRSWSRAIAATLLADRVVVGLRIPEAGGYLEDLFVEGIQPALANESPPRSALEAVARAWNSRSDRLGRDRQLWHYRRSIGRQSTADRAEPPPRASQKGAEE